MRQTNQLYIFLYYLLFTIIIDLNVLIIY